MIETWLLDKKLLDGYSIVYYTKVKTFMLYAIINAAYIKELILSDRALSPMRLVDVAIEMISLKEAKSSELFNPIPFFRILMIIH